MSKKAFWDCTMCGTRHLTRKKHLFTVGVQVPPMEDGGCGYGCPLLGSDEEGEYCREGHGVPADTSIDGKIIKLKPGPRCPRWQDPGAEDVQHVTSVLLEGLMIDGSHHKQYAIELALENLIGSEKFLKLKKENGWEDGIP